MFERPKPRLNYERSFRRDSFNNRPEAARCHIGDADEPRASFVFSIRFNASFIYNACTRRKIIARIIGVVIKKNAPRTNRAAINNHYVFGSICSKLLMPARLMTNFDPRVFPIIIYECLINSFVLITKMDKLTINQSDWHTSINRVKRNEIDAL